MPWENKSSGPSLSRAKQRASPSLCYGPGVDATMALSDLPLGYMRYVVFGRRVCLASSEEDLLKLFRVRILLLPREPP